MSGIPENEIEALSRPLPWLRSFEVGAKHIDAEHRAMIEACNDLCIVAARGANAADLRVLLTELIATVEGHFASEESLFPHIRFPSVTEHLAEHEGIRRHLAQMLTQIGFADSLLQRARETRSMLIEHILRHDMGYKTWVLHAVGM